MDEGDQILLGGFRDKHGSDELATQAFLARLDRRSVESTAAKFRMLKRFSAGQTNGK